MTMRQQVSMEKLIRSCPTLNGHQAAQLFEQFVSICVWDDELAADQVLLVLPKVAFDYEIVGYNVFVTTAPTTSALKFAFKDGVVENTDHVPEIAATETSVAWRVGDDSKAAIAVTAGNALTMFVKAVGSGTAGGYPNITLTIRRK